MSSESFDIFSLIGLSAIVSGGVSTFINYLINFYDFKKKAKIEFLKEKFGLYSYVTFELDKMRFMGQAMKKRKANLQARNFILSFVLLPIGKMKKY